MIEELVKEAEINSKEIYMKIDEVEAYFSKLVLEAFHEENIIESHFNMTTGYG